MPYPGWRRPRFPRRFRPGDPGLHPLARFTSASQPSLPCATNPAETDGPRTVSLPYVRALNAIDGTSTLGSCCWRSGYHRHRPIPVSGEQLQTTPAPTSYGHSDSVNLSAPFPGHVRYETEPVQSLGIVALDHPGLVQATPVTTNTPYNQPSAHPPLQVSWP